MKFTIQTDIFKKAIEATSHATSTGNLTPILENILIQVRIGNVTLIGNNLEMAIEYTIEKGVHIESVGSFTVSAKFLSSFVALVQDAEITVELEAKGTLLLSTNSGNTRVKGIDAEKFPSIPKLTHTNSFSLPAKDFKGAIEKTIFSTADGNIRPMLAGIMMKASGNTIIFASTDSFRLSEYIMEVKTPVEYAPIIIPKRTALEITKLIDESIEQISFTLDDSQIVIEIGDIKISSRLLAGKFPDHASFFPKEFQTRTTVLRSDCINAIRQVNLVAKQNNYNVRMRSHENGYLEIFSGDTEFGTSNRTVSATLEGKSDTIGINSEYLLAVLSVIHADYISFEYKNPLSPIVITGVASENNSNSYRHLIMPLKI